MGDVVSLFSVIIMKFKSKFNQSKIYFHCDLPWEKIKSVKWMNERASSNKAYVPTTVSEQFIIKQGSINYYFSNLHLSSMASSQLLGFCKCLCQ